MKLDAATIILIPAAIGINYLGKMFAELLKLPLWMDSIGTCFAAVIAGPVVGAIVGAVINILYGVTMGTISTIYALTNVGIAITVAIFAHKGIMKKFSGALLTGLVVGIVACLISTPLNLLLWGGTTGNIWGDCVFAACMEQGMPMWLASLLDEAVVDIPDKLITVLLVYGACKGVPESFLKVYQSEESAEEALQQK